MEAERLSEVLDVPVQRKNVLETGWILQCQEKTF